MLSTQKVEQVHCGKKRPAEVQQSALVKLYNNVAKTKNSKVLGSKRFGERSTTFYNIFL